MQRPEDGSDVTGFGSFDNSTCKRVQDLLEPGDLRLGQVVIKRVAAVKLLLRLVKRWQTDIKKISPICGYLSSSSCCTCISTNS